MSKKKTKSKRRRSTGMVKKGRPAPQTRRTGGEEQKTSPPSDGTGSNGARDGGKLYAAARAGQRVAEPVRAVQTNSTQGEAQEDNLGGWPYIVINTPEDFEKLTTWFENITLQDERQAVGLATFGDSVFLATKGSGMIIPGEALNSVMAKDILKRRLLAQGGSSFISRSVATDMDNLDRILKFTEEEKGLVLEKFLHDMPTLSYSTGHPFMGRQEITGIKDALDAATVGPMMAVDAPAYHYKVGMPLLRHWLSSFELDHGTPSGHRWVITYDYLIFRMAAHYTRDPTMIQWFIDGKDPLHEFGEVTQLGRNEAMAFFLWLVCGEDMVLMEREHPQWTSHMPENPQMVKAQHIDKKIPSFRMGLITLMEQSQVDRRAFTFWGRLSPPRLSPAELLHFILFGSVQDLLDVVVVSIANEGSSNHWLVTREENSLDTWLRAQIVGYNEDINVQEWQQFLEGIAGLRDPLMNIKLDAKVAVE